MECHRTASQFPSSAQCNPYIQLLQKSLIKHGIKNHPHSQQNDGYGLPLPKLDKHWLIRHQGRVDVLHFHWLQKFYRAATREASEMRIAEFTEYCELAHSLGYKIAFTFHNFLPHEGMGQEMDLAVRRLIIRYADVLTCFSERQRVRLEEVFGPLKLSVIPHPNYMEYYPNTLSQLECRIRLGLPMEARILTYIGLVRPYKQLTSLIDHFITLNDPNTYLLLAGMPLDAVAGHEVADQAKGHSKIRCILEWIHDEEIQVFMNASDAIILPYKQCWTSGALMLAFSFGKPVITADPIMLDDTSGLGFFYNDEDEMEAALQAGIGSTDLQTMGKKCLAMARDCSWDTFGKQLSTAYQASFGSNKLPEYVPITTEIQA